ncbi:hypothetical protein JYU34_000038 [Plutella xylostella]|uniref:Circadian locomoter output cycles protein kaput n=1 Tax=Plutella xylostella TaxID=51655 RepID=A0ABQ7R6P0_PLUXY|nr:hypothetical protein JYU34_000038 [Plutella xylostella]
MDDDGDDKDDSKRRTRNLSEKKRRDQFNLLVNELSAMISTNNRKMDKSTVLKSTISFLKNHNDITVRSRAHDVTEDWKPPFLSNEEFSYLVLEALEGFLLVLSANGRVHYASESVAALLGHNPSDMMNQSIFELAHEEDRPRLYALLQSVDPARVGHVKDSDIRFHCHIRRGAPDPRGDRSYETVDFCGHFRTSTDHEGEDRPSFLQPEHEETKVILVCTGRLRSPHLIRDVSLVDSARNEFTSRHSLEWKFLFLDHRASPIIGYLPFEVLGTSGYDYYHFDDLEKVVSCHEALMQKGELTSCRYRFLTKGQQWIWLRTRYYITYHQWNSKPEFVVCTHQVVSYAEISESEELKQDESCELSVAAEPPPAPPAPAPAPAPLDEARALSPCMSDASDAFTASYQIPSQPASVKSASAGSTAGTSATAATAGTASTHWRLAPSAMSIDNDMQVKETGAAPQHAIGAQYLEPSPYVGAMNVGAVSVGAVSVGAVLPLPLPVLVTPDQAQVCNSALQRKHEELQQMIVRQQAELRQVKEQLLLARLGILPPLINTPYVTSEDMLQGQHLPQLVYETPAYHPRLHEPPPPPQ